MEGKAFCSWSGGKDSCLALYRAMREGVEVGCLLTMLRGCGGVSRSHGLRAELLQRQSKALGAYHIGVQVSGGGADYSCSFDRVAERLVSIGYTHGVFGDIFVEEHRKWVVEAGKRNGFIPIFPLWGESTGSLFRDFVGLGFKSVIVSERKGLAEGGLIGKVLDMEMLDWLETRGMDPCGENGEYHTFTYDGPIFREAVGFEVVGEEEDDRYRYLIIS